MFVALQRVKTGDWKFQNYDMNTSYLVSPVPSTLHMFFSFALFVFEPSCQDAHCRISSVKNVGVWMHGRVYAYAHACVPADSPKRIHAPQSMRARSQERVHMQARGAMCSDSRVGACKVPHIMLRWTWHWCIHIRARHARTHTDTCHTDTEMCMHLLRASVGVCVGEWGGEWRVKSGR